MTSEEERCGFCRTTWTPGFGCTYLFCPNYGVEAEEEEEEVAKDRVSRLRDVYLD